MKLKYILLSVIISVSTTGCFYRNIGYTDKINSLNTTIDTQLRSINNSNNCLSFKTDDVFTKTELSIMKENMKSILENNFPKKSSLKKAVEILQLQAGAICQIKTTDTSTNAIQSICTYSPESVQGMKKLNITGWEIYVAQWQKDNFEINITAKNDLIDDIIVKIVSGQCYQIDKDIYEKYKVVKKVKEITR